MDFQNRGIACFTNNGNNICYLNTILHVLTNTIELSKYLLSCKKTKGELTLSYKYILIEMLNNKNTSSNTFKHILGKNDKSFDNNDQNDVNDLLMSLLNIFHEEIKYPISIVLEGKIKSNYDKLCLQGFKHFDNFISSNYSKIIELFYGTIINNLTCQTCNKTINSFEVFNTLSLAIVKSQISLSEKINLHSLIANFTRSETINDFYCEMCKKNAVVIRQQLLWELPPILVFQFKRFTNSMKKIIDDITIYDEIDMKIHLHDEKIINGSNNTIYELYAIINHMGSYELGHYTSFCKNLNGSWYYYDNNNVSKVNIKVSSSNYYMLFYRLKSI